MIGKEVREAGAARGPDLVGLIRVLGFILSAVGTQLWQGNYPKVNDCVLTPDSISDSLKCSKDC